ncbi:hypothetical protein TNCV_1324471 [Trichonephila clavipes]|nr:hypothetical protein TNCV_1324471 [Trichonephila clavipes]
MQPPYLMIGCWDVSRHVIPVFGGAPSCWNHTFGRSLSDKTRKLDNMSFSNDKYPDLLVKYLPDQFAFKCCASDIYGPMILMSNFCSTSRIIQ